MAPRILNIRARLSFLAFFPRLAVPLGPVGSY